MGDKPMNTEDAPKITFPCDGYVIKVVGDSHPEYVPFVTQVLQKYDITITETSYSTNQSKNGRFVSLTVRMRIEREEHLTQLFEELKVNDMVKMVI